MPPVPARPRRPATPSPARRTPCRTTQPSPREPRVGKAGHGRDRSGPVTRPDRGRRQSELVRAESLEQEWRGDQRVVQEGQGPPGTRPRHVGEPALLLEGPRRVGGVVDRACAREAALLHPDDDDVVELETLGGMGGGKAEDRVVAAERGEPCAGRADGSGEGRGVRIAGCPAEQVPNHLAEVGAAAFSCLASGAGRPRRAAVRGRSVAPPVVRALRRRAATRRAARSGVPGRASRARGQRRPRAAARGWSAPGPHGSIHRQATTRARAGRGPSPRCHPARGPGCLSHASPP